MNSSYSLPKGKTASSRRHFISIRGLAVPSATALTMISLLTLGSGAQAAGTVIYKAANTTDLNTSGSFVMASGGTTAATPPTTGTGSYTGSTGSTTANVNALILEWDSTVTAANVTRTGGGSGATFAVDGIVIANPGGPVTINQNNGTTTVGLSGIDMSSATQDLTFSGGTVRVGPGVNTAIGETWKVDSGRTLTLNSALSAEGGTNTLTLGGGADGNGSIIFNGGVGQGSAALKTIINGPTVTFNGANTTSGTTTISAGVLQVGSGGATGALGSGAVTDNASLVFNRSDTALNVGTAIGGTGTVTMSGTGTVTLSGGNTYAGGTTVNSGTLALGAAAADGTGLLTVNSGGTTTVTAAGALGGAVTLAGGTLQNSNLTGTTLSNTQSAGLLSLTTGTGSMLDFGTGNTGAVFSFTGFGAAGTGMLTIDNWAGNANTGGGLDQFLIGGTPLTAAQLSQITFSIGGQTFGATQNTSTGEVIADIAAAPEPSQYAAFGLGLLGLGVLTLRARRRV